MSHPIASHVEQLVSRHRRPEPHTRTSIITILLEVSQLAFSDTLTPQERASLEEQVFFQTCDRLGIDRCIAEQIGQQCSACFEKCCQPQDEGGCCGCFR